MNKNVSIQHSIKYGILALIVAITCFAIHSHSTDFLEVAIVALVASSTSLILDMYLPLMNTSFYS